MYHFAEPYTVKPGDTLNSIATSHELKLSQILRLNPQITNPDLIYPGQTIHLLKVLPMSMFTVKPGDTLYSILHPYNQDLMQYYEFTITMDEVLAYNPSITNPNLIYPGMRIYVPEIL